jgi:hypothetical protein
MPRFRLSLLLLAFTFAALLLAGTPASAAPAGQCNAPVSAVATGVPAPTFMIFPPPGDYIICSCDFCKRNPDVECRISPSGYSIMCSDWSLTHC